MKIITSLGDFDGWESLEIEMRCCHIKYVFVNKVLGEFVLENVNYSYEELLDLIAMKS